MRAPPRGRRTSKRQLNKRKLRRPEGSIVPARAARRTSFVPAGVHGLRLRLPPAPLPTPAPATHPDADRSPFHRSHFLLFESTVRTSASSIASPRRLPPVCVFTSHPSGRARFPPAPLPALAPATHAVANCFPPQPIVSPQPTASPRAPPPRRAHLALLGRVGIPRRLQDAAGGAAAARALMVSGWGPGPPPSRGACPAPGR